MLVSKKVYNDLKKAYESSIEAKNQAISALETVIDQYRKEVENLEARINYHRAKAEKRGKKYNATTTTITERDHDPYVEE